MADINNFDPRPVRPPLNRHLDFFDTDGDGIIWYHDTVFGLHKLGFNWLTSVALGFCGNIAFSSKTVYHPGLADITSIWSLLYFLPWLIYTYIPDPFLRVYQRNLVWAKHTASTHVFDKDGYFDEAAFEKIWAYSGSPEKESLTLQEAIKMIKSYRHGLSDGSGLIKGPFEWNLLFWVVAPADGRVTKAEVRSVYDGSIFTEIAKRRALEKANGTFKYSTVNWFQL